MPTAGTLSPAVEPMMAVMRHRVLVFKHEP